jgi:SPFH domain/Band 7 family protein
VELNEIFLIGAAVVAGASLLLAWVLYLKFFVIVPPNQALVIFGKGATVGSGRRASSHAGPRIVVGGGAFVPPWGKGHGFLPLHTFDVDAQVRATTPVGPALSRGWDVRIGVQAKIPSDPEGLRTAAENLLGKSEEEIKDLVRRAVEGYVPTVLAKLPEGEADHDWDRIGAEIQSYAATDLVGVGLVIRSLTVKQISPGGLGDSSILLPESRLEFPRAGGSGGMPPSRFHGLEARLGAVERSLEVLGLDPAGDPVGAEPASRVDGATGRAGHTSDPAEGASDGLSSPYESTDARSLSRPRRPRGVEPGGGRGDAAGPLLSVENLR